MVGRAALNIAGTNDTYFFNDTKYAVIRWQPGSGGDSIQYGPTEIYKEWFTLKEAGFAWVDAVLPIPGHEHRAYFFCGTDYVRIDYVPGSSIEKIIGGVRPIEEGWPSLKKADFIYVEGALMVPGKRDEVYFFCGEQYCRVRFREGQNEDELLSGPTSIASGWNGIKFSKIETIIPEPGNPTNAYAFSGSNYVLFNAVSGELIYGPEDVPSSWKALKQAGFY